jgi:hypothetical protein
LLLALSRHIEQGTNSSGRDSNTYETMKENELFESASLSLVFTI